MAKETRKIDTSIKAEEGLKKSIVQIEERLKRIAEERSELSKDSVQNQEMLNKLRQEELEITEKQRKTEKEIDKLTDKRTDDNENLQNIADKYLETLKDHQDKIEQMSDDSRGFLGTQDHIGKLMEQVHNTLESNVALHKEQGSLSEKYLGFMDTSVNYASMSESLQENILEGVERANLGEYTSIDLSSQKLGLRKAEKYLLENRASMTDKEIEAAESNLQLMKKSYQSNIDMNGALVEASKSSKAILGTFDSMMKLDLKGAIRSWFKLDEMNDKIKTQLRGSLVGVVKEFRGEGGLAGGFKAAGKELGGLLKMAPKLAIGFGIAGIAAGVGLLAKAVMHADEEVANLGKEFGISYKEARGLHHAAIDISNEMGLTGIQAKEVTAAMADVGEMMGGIDIAAQMSAGNEKVKELVKQTAVLTKQFGLSGEEVGKIQDLATITGKSMDNLVKESVELGKGTMTAKQSLKVLSTIPPQVAVAFKGSTKELIAAAQKAKMLGMELGKVQQIGRGMLDIEQSLEAEMEARVLTGKNLNLDAARQYALQGDTFKLQEEILNQAGSLEDFTKMNTLQQESMAKALGMSVEEMTKMLTNAEKLKKADISSDYAARLDAMESAAELEKEAAGARSKEQKDYIMQLAAEKRSASLKETMASLLEKIKAKFAPIIDAVLGVVGGLKDGNAGVSKFEEIISQIDFKEIAEQVKAVLPKLIEGFTTLIKKLPDIIKMVANFVEKLSGGIGPVTSIMGMINPGIAGFGIMALKIGGPGGVATGLKLAAGGAKGLFDLVKGPLQDGIGKLAGGVTDKLGGAFGKVADKAKSGLGGVMEKMGKSKTPDVPSAGKGGGAMESISKMFEKMDPKKLLAGAAALLIVAAALYVAAKAMQEFSTGVSWKGVIMGITTLGALVLAVMVLGSIMSSPTGAGAIMGGAAALLILSAALYVMGKAMQEFSKGAVILIPFFQEMTKLDMGKLALLAVNIALLGGAFALLGTMMVPIMMGAAAFAVLGASLAVFGVAAMIAGKGIKDITTSIAELLNFDSSKFDGVAKGLGTIGDAILKMGAGSLMSGVGDGISKLFGGGESPLDKVANISQKLNPEKLSATAKAIKDLADSFKYFAEETAKLKEFDTDKLQQIIEKMEEVKDVENSGALSKSVTGVANAVTGFIGNIFGSPEKQSTQPVSAGGGSVAVAASGGGGTNMANVEKKLDTLISVISQAANQPLVIKFGEKTVEEIKSQLNFKAATSIGVNNKTYAKTI